ncbi:uncharacterized protein IWZ02DRAFT_276418 [Phyllosticta citriasiana]|uniref:C2H2-type domain-containing protein n=1 Tax=Phyllosticta citriasiana TaxID=595635 RepID=A0ABR1KYY3_9PEZI
MTATREISRSANSHRSSMATVASSLPSRHSHSRTSSSLSSSLNPTHRVSRRKSVSTAAASNVAAMAAAVESSPAPRRSNKSTLTPRGPPGFNHAPSSVPSGASGFMGPASYAKGSAIADGPPLTSLDDKNNKSRTRRASEGSRAKEGGKRASGSELRCEKCGKGYKHSSCLTKHLWEHTPEWAITSKLLISKHQQVQLLEAASVLVNMNQEAQAESVKASESDQSSASPDGSSSDYRDGMSSAETTPPPHGDDLVGSFGRSYPEKRFSSNSSAYSQSYQSSTFSESVPSYYHDRPTTSGTSTTAYDDEDQADLAAAVGLLSCSFGTPQSKPIVLPPDVPPVPPVPARFAGNSFGSTAIATPPGEHQYATSMRSYYASRHKEEDVDMDDDDDEDDHRRRGRSDDDDEGMFGRMEE